MAQSDVSRPKPTPVPKPPLEIYCRRCSATTMRIVTVLPVLLCDDGLPFGDERQPTYRCPTCGGVLKLSDSVEAASADRSPKMIAPSRGMASRNRLAASGRSGIFRPMNKLVDPSRV
jgi:hypothetical protein